MRLRLYLIEIEYAPEFHDSVFILFKCIVKRINLGMQGIDWKVKFEFSRFQV